MSGTPLSSTRVLRTALIWGAVIGGGVTVIAAVVGALVAQADGAWSGVVGALVGMIFPALTAVSILVANRWYGSESYLQIFFGIVMGGWLLKFVLVIVLLLVLQQVAWIVPAVFYGALVGAAVLSLVVDLLVITRNRVPAVSDVELPTVAPED